MSLPPEHKRCVLDGAPELEREALTSILENTPEANLVYLDRDFNYVTVNSTYANSSGYSTDELRCRNHFELFPNSPDEAIFRRVRETGEAVVFKARPMERADRPERGVTYWDWSLTPIKGDDGEVRGFVYSLVDVTESVRHRHFADALGRLDILIHSTLEFNEMLGQVMGEAAVALGCDSVTVGLRQDNEWEMFNLNPVSCDIQGTRMGLGDMRIAEKAVAERATILVGDASTAPDAVGQLLPDGTQSALSVPLVVRDEVVGVLGLSCRGNGLVFTEPAVEFVERLAASLALGLANTRLYETEREAARLESSLNRILTAFISAKEPAHVLRDVVDESLDALSADYSLILEIDGGDWVVRNVFGDEGAEQALMRYPMDERPVIKRGVESGTIQYVEDVLAHPTVNRQIAERFGIKAFASVPLILRGEVLGVLELAYLKGPRYFDRAEKDFLENLMVAVSLALEQSREYDSKRHIAETLQQGLVSLPDAIEGIDFTKTYHSASEASMVGGDFYDLFEVEHGLVGITIGDISGKGIDAAVLTSLVKNTLRAHAIEEGKTPADVMRFANQILLHGSPSDIFATVFFGLLDRRDGRMVYCNAGHTSPAIASTDGRVRSLAANSPLVGAFAEVEFGNTETSLSPDDLLFLYTDGLLEARVGPEIFGEERIFSRLSKLWSGETTAVADSIIDDAVDFAGGRLADDLATLAVRLIPS